MLAVVATLAGLRALPAVYKGMQPVTSGEIAESVFRAAMLPPHVNVNTIELMLVAQVFAGFQVARTNDRDGFAVTIRRDRLPR